MEDKIHVRKIFQSYRQEKREKREVKLLRFELNFYKLFKVCHMLIVSVRLLLILRILIFIHPVMAVSFNNLMTNGY